MNNIQLQFTEALEATIGIFPRFDQYSKRKTEV